MVLSMWTAILKDAKNDKHKKYVMQKLTYYRIEVEWPIYAYVNWTIITHVVQIMGCSLLSPNPLSESMLISWLTDCEMVYQNLDKNLTIFIQENPFYNALCKITTILFWSQSIKVNSCPSPADPRSEELWIWKRHTGDFQLKQGGRKTSLVMFSATRL